MPGKARKKPKVQKDPSLCEVPEKITRGRKGKKTSKTTEIELASKSPRIIAKRREEIVSRGPVLGKPSMIQSTYGIRGNFELVVPLSAGGLGYYWRNNDHDELPWYGPVEFGADAGLFDGVSLIQGNFGEMGNLELVAVDYGGHNLVHFWRETGPNFDWHGPNQISDKALVPLFSGNPAMIQSNFGCRGNFDVVVPKAEGGFSYYWRDNDDPALAWNGPFDFATDSGIFDSVSLIQGNFGETGDLELVARSDDQLLHFWRDFGHDIEWHGPFPIDSGVKGTPSMIKSRFGIKGNYEMVVPLSSGGLAHYWRDNDDAHLHWYGPFMFAMNMSKVEGVSLIQSNFDDPGHLEIVVQVNGQLAFFWRDSGPDFRWNGPYYLTT